MAYQRSAVTSCSACHKTIPIGLAVIRSIAFRTVAYCRDCLPREDHNA